MSVDKSNTKLFSEIRQLIEDSRNAVAQTVNAGLTAMYWNIGKRINDDVLKNKRAEYGKQIVATLSKQLIQDYGRSFTEKNIRRMMQFSAMFKDFEIVASLMRQLSWTHFTILMPIKDELKLEFYTQMCRIEKWSVRTLKKKIDSMLFERTAISNKPKELLARKLHQFTKQSKMMIDNR